MKKILFFLFLLIGIYSYGQTSPIGLEQKKTIGGFFDNAFDQYGNSYNMSYLQVSKSKNNPNARMAVASCSSGSMFDLYFETGCGMEIVGNTAHDARRAVVCRVFQDLSNFINSPLKNAGNTNKVRIWVRNMANINGVPSGVLGLATAFYNQPTNGITGTGGIADNEIWKTIHAGVDSYTNVAQSMSSLNTIPNPSGLYYHGMMAFNFNGINWNTNLATSAPVGTYDFYSVILHEVTHALGLSSLIDDNGQSQLGASQNFYSRYDTFLKNNDTSKLLLTAAACSAMYNYGFNPALNTSVLKPNPNVNSCITNQTTCNSAIKFVGTSTIPVYTPNCFEKGSSLSHFEDQCVAPNINDAYFVMSNAISNAVGVNTKRFLKPEERNVLADIGYSLNTTYGNNTNAFGSFKNYGGSVNTGITVAGINDGITSNGLYSFVGDQSVGITISGLLNNDTNATSFQCLQDVFDNSYTISATSGTATTSVVFTSSKTGLHLLRYVPVNAIGQNGNITYVYVYVNELNNCTASSPLDLVSNGDFEQYSVLPDAFGQIDRACGWNTPSTATPDYFHANSSYNFTKTPCNIFGSQSDKLGKNGYAGMWIIRDHGAQNYFETIKTKLSSPLLPNTAYSLSFDVSISEGASTNAIKFQAYLSSQLIVVPQYGAIPISNSNMLFTNPTFSHVSNGWERITFNFTTDNTAGEQYLYLGALNNVEFSYMTPASSIAGCPHNTYNSASYLNTGTTYYYIDNVSLVTTNGSKLTLPSTICINQNLDDLSNYLVAAPPNGTFTGAGVVNTAGVYSFNSSLAGSGSHIITYTYGNNPIVTLTSTINVGIVPLFVPIEPICYGTSLTLPTTSINGIIGTWSPSVNNLATTTYIFTPNEGQCANTTKLTVKVLPLYPQFVPITPICAGSDINLPSISANGVSGTWEPAVNNMATTTYTFTPNADQCANSRTLTVTVITNSAMCNGSCGIPTLILSSPETNNLTIYQRENWIETNTNYTISSGKEIIMKAGNYITLKPNTHIISGSVCDIGIEECDNSDNKYAKNSKIQNLNTETQNLDTEIDRVIFYPNPTKDIVTISTKTLRISEIMLVSLGGQVLTTVHNINTTPYLLDLTPYPTGTYIAIVKTEDGKEIKQKIVKN